MKKTKKNIKRLLCAVAEKVYCHKVLIFALMLPVCVYLVIFAVSRPAGVVEWDLWNQTLQALGFAPINDHHPVFATLIVKYCLEIFGSFSFYTLFQVLLLLFAICFGIATLHRMNVHRYIILAMSALYSFVPVFNFMGMYAAKDVVFTAFFSIFVITVFRVFYNKRFAKFDIAMLVIFGTLTMLSRSGAFVIVAPTLIVMTFFIKKQWREKIVSWGGVILLMAAVTLLIDVMYRPVKADAVKDGASIPIQMVGAVFNTPNANISDEQRQYFESILADGTTYDNYDPAVADPLKFALKIDETGLFLAETAKLCANNIKSCLRGYYRQTQGFWQFNYDQEYNLSPSSYSNALVESPRYLTRNHESSRGSFIGNIAARAKENGFMMDQQYLETLPPADLANVAYSAYGEQGKNITVPKDRFVKIVQSAIGPDRDTQFLKDRLATADTWLNQTMQQPALYLYIVICSFAIILFVRRSRYFLLAFVPIIMLFIVNFAFAPIAYFRYVMPIAFVSFFVFATAFGGLHNAFRRRADGAADE